MMIAQPRVPVRRGSDKDKRADVTPSEHSGSGDDAKSNSTPENPVVEEPRPRSPQCLVGGTTPRTPRDKVPKVDAKQLTSSRPSTPPSTAASSHDDTPRTSSKNETADMLTTSGGTVSGTALWLQQFDALFRKRALSVRRDRKAWASQILLPAIFVFMALVIARIMEVKEEEPPLKLDSDMFIGTMSAGSVHSSLEKNTFHISGTRDTPLASQVEAAFLASASEDDAWKYFPEGNSTLSEFYMENPRQVSSNFGAVSVRESGEDMNVTLWFNSKGYHSIPVMVNMWNNARFRLLGFEQAKVQAWSHPLPKTSALLQEEMSGSSQVFTDLTVAITVLLAMGFIPASFVVYLVHEKATSGKHQQLLTGITPFMYWVNSYAWDMVNFMIPLFICFLIFLVFQVGAYSGGNSIAVFFLLLSYGACMTPCMYCIEPCFTVPSTAYVTLIVTNIFTGTLSTLAVSVMEMYQNEIPNLKPATELFKTLFPWLLPNYCLGRGLVDIATNHYLNYAAEEFGLCVRPGPGGACTVSPLSWDVAGKFITRLFIMAPLWMCLRLLIEWGFFTRGMRLRAGRLLGSEAGWKGGNSGDDEAVVKEARRVTDSMAAARASGSSMADHLVLTDLAKTFTKRRCGIRRGKPFHAVRGINVGVPAGECFGLLGVNGAGKTTTMRMITGDTEITRGDILVGGYSTHTNRDRARQRLGYCPQFDALPDKLTVRETVALYARIRGVSSDSVWSTVDSMIKRMCLEAHQYNLCENLSGGNKRKLSTALALIGAPDVVLLDEPSTGVDVGARRFLWEVIGDIRRSGHAVVLTSHSMEECEVLCTRLTIMVHGQLRCLGSPTELKTKFGGGYTMAVKVNLKRDQFSGSACGADPCQMIRSFISQEIAEAKLAEESVGLYRYRLGGQGSQSSIPLAEIFKKLEEATKDGGALCGCISDYSLSQTSLEEVFLHFSQVGEREFAALSGAAVELPTAGRPVPALEDDTQDGAPAVVAVNVRRPSAKE